MAAASLPRVELSSLPRWSEQVDDQPADADPKPDQPTKFIYSAEINQKIILWEGDITTLNIDAIVNATNESLTDRTGICGQITERAGPELAIECMRLEGCRTGEAKITNGYELPAKRVIHTVGPRFNIKYRTAAENALHNCYRSCLQLLKESRLGSIAFCLINSERRGYPSEAAAHIAIRTVRRFLEHFGNGITDVVFCMPSDRDTAIYKSVLPLYFPVSAAAALRNKALLPEDTGNEFGETIVEERKIRIDAGASASLISSSSSSAAASSSFSSSAFSNPSAASSSSSTSSPFVYSSSAVLSPASNPFASNTQGHIVSEPDIDTRRAAAAAARQPEDDERLEAERQYLRYLRRARQEKFSDLQKLNFLYQAGVDLAGRPVVVLVAKHLPVTRVDMERVLLYVIALMDPIVEREYALVYVHTQMESENQPEFAWLRHVHDIFDRKYKKNLKTFYLVHPTFWLKTLLWFLTPFVSDKVWAKLRYIDSVYELYRYINRDQLDIPDFVFSHDLAINGAPSAAAAAAAAASSSSSSAASSSSSADIHDDSL